MLLACLLFIIKIRSNNVLKYFNFWTFLDPYSSKLFTLIYLLCLVWTYKRCRSKFFGTLFVYKYGLSVRLLTRTSSLNIRGWWRWRALYGNGNRKIAQKCKWVKRWRLSEWVSSALSLTPPSRLNVLHIFAILIIVVFIIITWSIITNSN